MEDLSLHILDVVENATGAGATLVEIAIREDPGKDLLILTIRDNGGGMDEEAARRARDPFFTSRTTRRVGLGLPFLEQAAQEAEGGLSIDSAPGEGTEITATFRASHIDRRPLGDTASTLISLIVGHPDVDFTYESDLGGEVVSLDTREVKAQLAGGGESGDQISITDPAVLELIRGLFRRCNRDGGAGE